MHAHAQTGTQRKTNSQGSYALKRTGHSLGLEGNLTVLRQPTKFDILMQSAVVFAGKLMKQLGMTLLATLLGSGKDWIVRASSAEVSKKLQGHMPDEQRPQQTSSYNNNYNSNYNSGYRGSDFRSFQEQGFPGFRN